MTYRSVLPLLTLAAVLTAAPAHAAVDDTVLVTRVGLDGPPADNTSSFSIDVQTANPSISGDGSKVAFITQASNLGGGPGLYVKDMTTGALQFLSALATVVNSGTSPGALLLQQPRLSDSGRYVCYVDFVGTKAHALVRDLADLSTRDAGEASFDMPNYRDLDHQLKTCDVSDDGTKVAYATTRALDGADAETGTPPVGAAGFPFLDVYVHDFTASGSDTLISRADGPAGADGNDYSIGPELTPDGRFVLFRSRADSLSSEDDNSLCNIFQRDLQTGQTRWVSRADGPAGGPGAASTLNSNVNVESGSADAAQSNDGRYVAFASTQRDLDPANPAKGTGAVYIRDMTAGTTHAAAVTTGPGGVSTTQLGNNNLPTITADGRFVGLGSNATTLDPTAVSAGTAFIEKEYVRDTTNDRTALISRAPGLLGAPNNGQASGAQLSADGRFEVFASVATNLVPGDFAGPLTSFGGFTGVDIFVRSLDPDRPLVADAPGVPLVGTPVLATKQPTVLTPIQGQLTPRAVQLLLKPSTKLRAVLAASKVKPKKPVAFTVKLSEYGILTLAVEQLKPGLVRTVKKTRRCVVASAVPRSKRRKAKHCTRHIAVAKRSLAGYEGVNRFALKTVLGAKRLAKGTYRLRGLEYDLASKTGQGGRTFTIR